MAQIRIADVLDSLSGDLRKALADALTRVGAGDIDARNLYREFVKAATRKCGTWEAVPNNCVDAD